MATGGNTNSTKGGYDCEFVTVPSKSLECPICLLTVRQPHVISCCGNQFCQPCIERIQNNSKPCPLCNEANFTTMLHKGVMREVKALMVRCPQKEIGCKWEGELGQLEEHLNPAGAGKGCGYVMVECRYKCGEMFLRRDVQEHELHQCLNRPVEVQVNTLTKMLETLGTKLDTLMTENEKLKEEVQDQSVQIGNLKGEVQSQNVEIGKLKSRSQQLEQENRNHKAEIETLKKQTSELSTKNQALERESKQMKKTVDTVPSLRASAMPEPPFFFTCYNVAHFMRTNYRWWSTPFYSHTGGYKMKVDTFMNGLDSSQGKEVSLFIAVMRGEFDDNLPWPFSGKVTVDMYNFSSEKWDSILTIDFKYATRDARVKPSGTGVNRPWGYGSFLIHRVLKERYLRDDIVRFKISRVEV